MKNHQPCAWTHEEYPPPLFDADEMVACPHASCSGRAGITRFCSDECVSKHWRLVHPGEVGDTASTCPECGDSFLVHDGNGCTAAGCNCKRAIEAIGVCHSCGSRRMRVVEEWHEKEDNSDHRTYRCECGAETETVERIVGGSLVLPPGDQ